MYTNVSQGAYLFQGNTLVLPDSIPDPRIYEPVPRDRIQDSFGDVEILAIPGVYKGGYIPCADLTPDRALPPGWRGINTRRALSLIAADAVADGSGPAGRLLRAYHIVQWRRESVFCGSCGSRNEDKPHELARICPVCSRHEYPRISPAIIVLIINNRGKALLAHNKNFTPGVYSLIAGFNEAGETLEATVVREVREEVGLEVGHIRYMTSQPWPFPNSLMLGFIARHAGGAIKVDGVEIEDARWFDRDRLPDLPGKGSVSRYLINLWIGGAL
ncbi:MAG: NAD(+) diphosphatase [Treponema sp.]|nr:NAD(+) diphosphatase [Treponema sp.]